MDDFAEWLRNGADGPSPIDPPASTKALPEDDGPPIPPLEAHASEVAR